MALVLGTNAGFVATAPTSDPTGGGETIDNEQNSFLDTSPSGSNIVIEMGWWVDPSFPGEEGDFELGIYTDEGNDEPETLVGKTSATAKGTSSGWKVVTGLSIPISSSTPYWLALAMENTASVTWTNDANTASQRALKNSTPPPLPSDWGTSSFKGSNFFYAFYALYEAAPEPSGFTRKIKIAGTFQDKPIKTKVGGTFVDKPIKIKVGGVFQDA